MFDDMFGAVTGPVSMDGRGVLHNCLHGTPYLGPHDEALCCDGVLINGVCTGGIHPAPQTPTQTAPPVATPGGISAYHQALIDAARRRGIPRGITSYVNPNLAHLSDPQAYLDENPVGMVAQAAGGIMGFISNNPLLTLAIVGGGIFLLSAGGSSKK